jgi:hypothetical protein
MAGRFVEGLHTVGVLQLKDKYHFMFIYMLCICTCVIIDEYCLYMLLYYGFCL